MRMRIGIRLGVALAVALACPSIASAQAKKSKGPTLPHPVLQSAFPAGVRAGESVDVTIRGADLEGATRLWFDHPGLRAFHLKGATFRVACAPGTPVGHHDLRAVGNYGLSNPRAFVVGDRPESVEIEPNNTPAQATKIEINSVVNGEIAMTDIDAFAFEGKKGRRVLFDLQGERIDSRLDATLRLFGPDGREIAESRDAFGADPFLDVTLPTDGRYLVKIHDVVYKGSADHGYRLTVTDGPHIDAVFPVLARAGESGVFTLFGRNLGGTPAPGLTVDGLPLERKTVTLSAPASFDPDPAFPAFGFVPSTGAARRGFEFALPSPSGSSNPVFIAEGVDPIVVEREPNDVADDAQPVAPPCDISGCFGAPGDLDVYRFKAKKGGVFWIDAGAQRIGSIADPVFTVEKVPDKGEPQNLATADDLTDRGDPARFVTRSVDAATRWVAPDDGLYQVAIGDLYGSQRGDVRLSYRLNIRPERPDFHLFVLPDGSNELDALTVPSGSRGVAWVLAVRADGFAGPIRVEAAELPPGVSVEPVVIAAGQVSAPVVFRAETGAKPAVGAVRLVGRSRFGDRKDDLGYVAGVETLGPDVAHEAVGGGIVWPAAVPAQPQPNNPPVALARLTRGFILKVIDHEPLTLSARLPNLTTTPGGMLAVELTVTRGEGFSEAVAVSLLGNLAAVKGAPPVAPITVAKAETSGVFPLVVPKTLSPGVYTLVFEGTGPYPFSKDPNAKTKPNVNLSAPSNPITVVVRPAPAGVAVNAKGGMIKAGGTLEIEVTVTPKGSPVEPVAVALAAPAGLKLSAEPVMAAPGKAVKLVVKAAAESPIGAASALAVRATVIERGAEVEVNEPLALTVTK